MKRILCVVLLLSSALSFTACARNGNVDYTKPGDTTAQTTKDPAITYVEDELPDNLNFDGAEIVILMPSDNKENDNWEGEITVEELTSNIVSDSIYNREKFVEDRLGVEISSVSERYDDYNKKVILQMTADENTYQIYAGSTVWFAPSAFDGYLVDLYELDYINLEKPWWSRNFIDAASFKDHLYMATGSLSLSLTRFLFAVYYNKTVANNYATEYPELNDLYSIVESGKWTYDKFYELGSGIYNDLNGNSERDADDLYGISLNNGISIDIIWSSFDINMLSKDENHWYYLDINQDKLYTSLDRMMKLIYNTVGCYVPINGDDIALDEISEKFAGDTVLFMINKLHQAERTTLRNMQSDYGIIPYPKYDENQKEYYSYAHDAYLSFSIPTTNPEPDTAAAVLEAMASYSYRETEPAYLDVALKGKYMSDSESRKMIDLVVDGFKVDASWIYCMKLGNIGSTFREVVRSKTEAYSSEYARIERIVNITLKSIGREID